MDKQGLLIQIAHHEGAIDYVPTDAQKITK